MAKTQAQTSIRDMIRDMIASEVRAAVGDIIGAEISQTNGHVADDTNDDTADKVYARTVERINSRQRRTRTAYPTTAYRRQLRDGRVRVTLFPTAAKVWSALVKADDLTNRDIVKATGLPKKTVESCVWYLRNHDASGNRVKAGSKSALVKSVDAAVE